MVNFIPLDTSQHADLKYERNFVHVERSHLLPVSIHEFGQAMEYYPIAFVKANAESGFYPVAVSGLRQGENLFYEAGKDWSETYIPLQTSVYPFLAAKTGKKLTDAVILFDEQAPQISNVKGINLFDEGGLPSPVMNALSQKSILTLNYIDQTKVFTNLLVELGLLKLYTPVNEGMSALKSLYIIDEQKLVDLSDSDFRVLRDNSYLSPIYASLFSLQNINSLIKLSSN